MPSLTRKMINGHAYYYLRECRRVNGKPKIVSQQYLGRVEDIVAALARPAAAAPQPHTARVRSFGGVVALYDLARRLGLVELIDRHVPKRGGGPTVGQYLVLAAINRCLAPRSKARCVDWYEQTVLPRLLPFRPAQLSSQRFWDHMDRVEAAAITAIDQELAARLVQQFHVDPRCLFYDATNFFTFIDTFNTRSRLAQRGHSKEGRDSLRLVGLALLVSADFHVPLLHHTYAGNQPDAPTFRSLADELLARYKTFATGVEKITLVFDKGNNAHDTVNGLKDYHFVGSLVPGQHPDLLAVSPRQLKPLEDARLEKVSTWRTHKAVYGHERTIVVTFNEALFAAQEKTLRREVAKRSKRLAKLQRALRGWQQKAKAGRAPTQAGTEKAVAQILSGRHMKELFEIDVTLGRRGLPILRYHFNRSHWNHLNRTLLGKTLLFTDRDDWSDAEIVRAYRGQAHVEAAFRTMKDPHWVSFRPMFHWTDQKVRVHAFYCVLALTLAGLLRRALAAKGIHISTAAMFEQLEQIRQVTVIYPAQRRAVRTQMVLGEISPLQQQLYDALDLGRHFPA